MKDRLGLQDIVRERVMVLDGAMGTMIQSYGLREDDFRGDQFRDITWQMAGNNDILNITRPDIIRDVHRRYLEAGADIITSNTFSSQRISMADYNVQDYVRDINLAGVRIAREIADEYTKKNPDKPRFVLGDVGPTNKSLSISPDVNNPALRSLSFDELKNQIEILGFPSYRANQIYEWLRRGCRDFSGMTNLPSDMSRVSFP